MNQINVGNLDLCGSTLGKSVVFTICTSISLVILYKISKYTNLNNNKKLLSLEDVKILASIIEDNLVRMLKFTVVNPFKIDSGNS